MNESGLFLACDNGDVRCPEVDVKACTTVTTSIPSTTVPTSSITDTVTMKSTVTLTETSHQTETTTTCSTKTPVPTSCSGCDPTSGQNLCDEDTVCDPVAKQCVCRKGFKHANSLSSNNQWRLSVGGSVYVSPGSSCSIGKNSKLF